MKKLSVVVLLSLFLVSSFVSAQVLESIADGAKNFYNTIFEPFGQFLLGSNTTDGELFFAKLLLFIMLASIVWYALDKFPPTQGKRSLIISLIVSILSVRYITPEWINTIILPYGAFAIAVTALIPLILFFFLVETGLQGHPALRKICWIFAAVVFVGLFFYRINVIPPGKEDFNPAYIYLIATVASVIFLIADETIQRAFTKARYANINEIKKIKIEAELVEEYNKYSKQLADGVLPESRARVLINNLRHRAKAHGIEEGIFPLPYNR